VLTNNGSGGFVLASSPRVGIGPWSVMAADVNGDGKLDLISANSGTNTLSVLFNTPAYAGRYAGDGSGLTSLNANALAGGLTTNLKAPVPGGFTNTLCLTNGVLRAVR
jgi:hypothetical protein